MTTSINGTANADLIDVRGTATSYKITAGSGNDVVYAGAGNDYLDGGSDNDLLDGGAGSDTLIGGSGNDTLIFRASENVGSSDVYDGGSGTADRLQLQLSYNEWIRADVQADVTNAQQYLTPPGGKAFQFTAFNLSVKNVEYLDVYVAGVKMDLSNHAVTLNSDALSASEDGPGPAVNLLANDSVPDLVKAISVSQQPLHGAVVLATNFADVAAPVANATYTPDPTYWQSLAEGQTATETFTYTVTDANGDVASKSATVTITGRNDAPVAQALSASTNEDTPTLLSPVFADVDQGDAASVSVDATGAVGLVTLSPDGTIAYDPRGHFDALAPGASATDIFHYTVKDSHGASSTQTASITVTGVNDAPSGSATAVLAHGTENTPYTLSAADLLAGFADPDGGVLSAAHLTADHATIVANSGGSFTIAPSQDYHGPVTLSYDVLDGQGGSIAASNNIVFDAVEGPPAMALRQFPSAAHNNVIVADVNADGRQDVIITNGLAGVGVLLGAGDGSFGPETDFAAGANTAFVAAADLDGDHNTDLVVTNYGFGVNTLSVLRGNGDGTFQSPVAYAAGETPWTVRLADIDGDAKLDAIVSSNSYANGFYTLKGNGDGSFQAPVNYPGIWSTVLVNATGLVVSDFNEDGKSDVLVVGYSYGDVHLYTGNGDGSMTSAATINTGHEAVLSLANADLNGDGHQDMAYSDLGGHVYVAFGNGDGTFQAERAYTIGTRSYDLSVADINGDGKSDLVVSNGDPWFTASQVGVSVLYNNGNGGFSDPVKYDTGQASGAIATADLNGDGRVDIVSANATTNLSVLLNDYHLI
ncbi:FG-GAP-like repeat-containing protein [Alsobacter sp. KACC 23698]|uniref:FG-GAP-like repeat-containing protein n=1 Tax=Alsobacter sp. KACC 23698 TaxID=3149229 RepID=A0AAU7JIX9_9HYPH